MVLWRRWIVFCIVWSQLQLMKNVIIPGLNAAQFIQNIHRQFLFHSCCHIFPVQPQQLPEHLHWLFGLMAQLFIGLNATKNAVVNVYYMNMQRRKSPQPVPHDLLETHSCRHMCLLLLSLVMVCLLFWGWLGFCFPFLNLSNPNPYAVCASLDLFLFSEHIFGPTLLYLCCYLWLLWNTFSITSPIWQWHAFLF